MARITNEQIFAALMGLKDDVSSLKKRVTKLEGNRNSTPKSGKGSSTATTKVVEANNKSTKLTIKDFEPKAQGDNYSWSSYKANRLKYCYYVATKGKAQSSNDCYKQGIKFDDIKASFEKAKTEFNKKYEYIPKAER